MYYQGQKIFLLAKNVLQGLVILGVLCSSQLWSNALNFFQPFAYFYSPWMAFFERTIYTGDWDLFFFLFQKNLCGFLKLGVISIFFKEIGTATYPDMYQLSLGRTNKFVTNKWYIVFLQYKRKIVILHQRLICPLVPKPEIKSPNICYAAVCYALVYQLPNIHNMALAILTYIWNKLLTIDDIG